MANPTSAELFTQMANAVEVLDQLRRYGGGSSSGVPAPNATNLIGVLDTLQQSYEGDFIDEADAAMMTLRAAVAGQISPGAAAAALRPFIKQYMKSVVGRTDLSNDDEMFQEWYRYMHDNALYVQSRVFTFGSPTAAGTNTGNGQIVRLTKDKYNYDIESGYVDSKRARCIADENTGTGRGQEVFEVKGQATARDEIERSGSGLTGTLAGITIDESLVNNAGFRSFDGTAASPTGLTSWTSSGGNSSSVYTLDSTNFFRAAPSDGSTSYALNVLADTILSQKLTVRGTELDDNTPYLVAIVWNRAVNSATGTLTIRLGDVFTTVTMAAQTGWNVTLVPSSTGQSNWYRLFARADMQIELDWDNTGGTGLLIGEVLFVPGTQFDGSWYWALPASAATYTPWRVLDEYTWPDIASGSAKNQTWIHRGFPGQYLPHANGSSISWSEA